MDWKEHGVKIVRAGKLDSNAAPREEPQPPESSLKSVQPASVGYVKISHSAMKKSGIYSS